LVGELGQERGAPFLEGGELSPERNAAEADECVDVNSSCFAGLMY